MGKLKSILKGLKLSHLAPETPAIANMLTGEVMGHSADRLADRFGISRADQDAFSARSHQNAAKVHRSPKPSPKPDPNPNLTLTTNPDPDPNPNQGARRRHLRGRDRRRQRQDARGGHPR